MADPARWPWQAWAVLCLLQLLNWLALLALRADIRQGKRKESKP